MGVFLGCISGFGAGRAVSTQFGSFIDEFSWEFGFTCAANAVDAVWEEMSTVGLVSRENVGGDFWRIWNRRIIGGGNIGWI